jgi:hypothetical protein
MAEIGRAFVGMLVAVALAVTTPVLGWCAPAQHRDQLFHPLFEHAHHEAARGPDHPTTTTPRTFATATWAASGQAQTFGWATAADALPPALTALPPARPAGFLLEQLSRPAEHLADPTFPPPR